MDGCFDTLLSSKTPSSLFASDLFFADSPFAGASNCITRDVTSPRRNKQLACERCHSQKVRCVRSRFVGDTCDRCRQAGVQCIGRAAQRMGRPCRSQVTASTKVERRGGSSEYDTDEGSVGHKRRRTWGGIIGAEPIDTVGADLHNPNFSPWSKKVDGFDFVFDPTLSREGDSGDSTASTFEADLTLEQALSSHASTSPRSHAEFDGTPTIGDTDLTPCLPDNDFISGEQNQGDDQCLKISSILEVLASCEALLSNSKNKSEAYARENSSVLDSECPDLSHQRSRRLVQLSRMLSSRDLEQLFTISQIFADTLHRPVSPLSADGSRGASSTSLRLLAPDYKNRLMAAIMCYLRLLQLWRIALLSLAEASCFPSTKLGFGDFELGSSPPLQVLLRKQLSTYLLRQMHRAMYDVLSQHGIAADSIDASELSPGDLSAFMLRHMLKDMHERERDLQSILVETSL